MKITLVAAVNSWIAMIQLHSDEVKRECLKMYINGMEVSVIERGHCRYITQRSSTAEAGWENIFTRACGPEKPFEVGNSMN